MPSGNSGASCFISMPPELIDSPIGESVRQAAKQAGFRPVDTDANVLDPLLARSLPESIASAECVIADLSSSSSLLYYELGLASALGKPVFLIGQDIMVQNFSGSPVLHYTTSSAGLRALQRALSSELRRYRRFPRQPRSFLGSRSRSLFAVDWDRLSREDFENLCLELLGQLGYKRLQWQTHSSDIDIVAELPKKDPDGFEYRELWLIAIGRSEIIERYYDLAAHDPEFLLQRLLKPSRYQEITNRDQQESIILLSISLDEFREQVDLPFEEELRLKRRAPNSYVRFRRWDRNYLTNLIYQFPPIGFKYFSDEGRSKSRFRKTPEQLYEENLVLTRQLTLERDLRVRAERDAVWKDISFSAAHKMGNPAFAIETNLDPLELRITTGRIAEGIEIIGDIRGSVEKIKSIISQFKSLTNAQKIAPIALRLKPLLDESCRLLSNHGIECAVSCSTEIAIVADPPRLSECFDEIAVNSLKWMDKEPKTMRIEASSPPDSDIPDGLETGPSYVRIEFADNGAGVPAEDKTKIFDAFYTTSVHGTGLGLALVRRIIEGHRGLIIENGTPGQGARFVVYLPLALSNQDTPTLEM